MKNVLKIPIGEEGGGGSWQDQGNITKWKLWSRLCVQANNNEWERRWISLSNPKSWLTTSSVKNAR